MNPDEFLKKVNHSIKTGELNNDLLKHENKFMRSKYLFKMIENATKVLKTFNFKDTIIIENKIAYIVSNDIKFKVNTFFLKNTGSKYFHNH